MKIAIIGAGMAGLTCAGRLSANGHDVQLFDKGRGPGGRMASRRAEVAGQTLHFDHGAQYLTVRDERFRRKVESWEADGLVTPWPAAGEGAWVGTPAMNAPVKAMATAADVSFGIRVDTVRAVGTGWKLVGQEVPRAIYDAVISAVPAEQVPELLAGSAPEMATLAAETVSDPCWVVQATPEWSRENLEEEPETVIPLLLHRLSEQAGSALPDIVHSSAHRWRYAMCGNAGKGALWDGARHIGACGDWLHGPRIENAFLSGWELAQKVMENT